MSTLTVVLSHLPAATVDEQLAMLRDVAPDERFVVCHGGDRRESDAVRAAEAVHLDDPTLRGAPRSFQSYHQLFDTVAGRWMGDAEHDSVYFVEFDHLILRGDYAASLSELAGRTGADMLGKDCLPRRGTNWEHHGRFRRDPALLAHLRRISVREDPEALFGTLGDGMWLTRDALLGYAGVEAHPPCYGECYVPTLLHHLGFRVVDIGTHSPLYDAVRWEPEVGAEEVAALAAAGATFAHPVKNLAVWRRVAADRTEPFI